MSQSIDVGTVLGGRYKVTSSIVESHGGDLVLDGVDQILNRPVSILVSAPDNSEQLAQSAREVATGERHVGIQVLDLGVSHGATYLITNHAAAADLLDLIVAQDSPYVEPFFTDTLGSEIFGEARSREPETYDGLYDHNSQDYIRYPEGEGNSSGPAPASAAQDDAGARPVPPPPAGPPRSASPGAAAGLAAGAAGAAGAASAGANPSKVTPWPSKSPNAPQGAPSQGAPATAPSPSQAPRYVAEPTQPVKTPPPPSPSGPGTGSGGASGPNRGTAFPSGARQAEWSSPSDRIFDRDDELEEDDESTRPKSVPWLVGGILALVLIVALIFAFTTLGSVFQPQGTGTKSSAPSASTAPPQSAQSGQSSAPAPAVAPAIDSVTRLNPGELTFASQFDSKLTATYDGNPATYWSDMEFAREDWGGFTKSVSLAVKLKDVSDIKQIELDQLGGTGGSVSVYTNSQPDVAGATLVGTNTFNTTQLVFPLPNAVKAQYVIIQINALPRLASPKTQYPFGLRLAEIKVQ